MPSKSFLTEDGKHLLRDLALKEEARELVAEIKGRIVEPQEIPAAPIVAIGDRVTLSLRRSGRRPEIAIVDLRERRSVEASAIYELEGYLLLSSENPPGRITVGSWDMVRLSLELASKGFRVALVIKGEEDLLGFPVAIMAPDGWLMIYGQPDVGMILVEVNESVKMRAKGLLMNAFNPL